VRTLTRADVARRLRKSIATVRRLEHRVLFPVRDEHGVHRFDESEVELARRDSESLKRYARSRWLEDKVRDDEWKARTASPRRISKKTRRVIPSEYAALADDLQSALGALIARFEVGHLLSCGLDVQLFTRAFDAVTRLRAVAQR
jgi:hypothetical protein